MGENPDHDREEAPGRPAVPQEDSRQQAEEGGGQRTEGRRERVREASEAVAIVAAGVLVGGGIGQLVGVALGVFNPSALGIIGVVVGTCASVPLTRAALKR